jgi:tripartite ATP-independent transporter DctM subunit
MLADLMLVVLFGLLLVLGVPIAICIGLATLGALVLSIDALPAMTTLAQRMAGGLNSFALLAIPLYIVSGIVMGRSSMATRLIRFARCLVGMVPGGLAFVNVLSSAMFGAIAGTAVAANTAVGTVMIPEMEKAGYGRDFAAAITATGSTVGLLIPPSNILIVYGVAAGGVSIAALFMAGYLPGLLVSASLMVVCAWHAKKLKLPPAGRVSLREAAHATLDALPSLALIIIVMGGILAGMFTATEAGAIAVIYSMALAGPVYRDLKPSDLLPIFTRSVETTAIVLFLIATSVAMSWVLAYREIPAEIANALLGISDNPIVLLLIINLTLLVVGMFMDMTPAVLIFTPIFLPVAVEIGISPLHFGIMIVLNLMIGLCTPPVGNVLFLSCAIANTTISRMMRPLLPMYVAMIAALMLVTYVPAISEWLPRQLGLID